MGGVGDLTRSVSDGISGLVGGSIAAHLLAAQKGAAILRVHDVRETVQALRVAAAIGAAG